MVKIEIPLRYRKLGINCSSGADSSLLLYFMGFVCKERSDIELSVITNRNFARDTGQPERVKKIIDFLHDYHGIEYVKDHWIFDIPDYSYRGRYIEQLFNDNKVDLILSGVTSNPKSKEPIYVTNYKNETVNLTNFPIPERSNNRGSWFLSVNGIDKHKPAKGKNYNNFYSPFSHVDKREILRMYRINGLFDTLFPITRSCEGEDYQTNNFTTECGNCWWCLERHWAIRETQHEVN